MGPVVVNPTVYNILTRPARYSAGLGCAEWETDIELPGGRNHSRMRNGNRMKIEVAWGIGVGWEMGVEWELQVGWKMGVEWELQVGWESVRGCKLEEDGTREEVGEECRTEGRV